MPETPVNISDARIDRSIDVTREDSNPTRSEFAIYEDINNKLSALLENSEKSKEDLALREFELKDNLGKRSLDIRERDSNFHRKARSAGVTIGGAYVLFVAIFLIYIVLSDSKDLFDEANWHVSVSLIAGCFLSMFGTVALVLRGVFKQSEDGPIGAVTPESIKALAEAIKPLSGILRVKE